MQMYIFRENYNYEKAYITLIEEDRFYSKISKIRNVRMKICENSFCGTFYPVLQFIQLCSILRIITTFVTELYLIFISENIVCHE